LDHIERFYATIERKEVDRPACWLGLPVPEALEGLFNHFKERSLRELKLKINDDIWTVDVPYHDPPNNHITMAFDFPKKGQTMKNRTLTAPGFFEDYYDPLNDDIDKFNWPDPEDHMDPEECWRIIEDTPKGFPIMGILWSAHFQDLYSAFGMTNAFVKMYKYPDIVNAVHDKIIKFYLKANKIFYEATRGMLDAVLIGNDFGGQKGLMLSPEMLKKFAIPGTKKLVDQAKKYGLKVIYHSCGSIFEAIPLLIELGIDAIHPIQALATNMDAKRLKTHYGNQISFCGGVDHQKLLVFGNPNQIKEKVGELKEIFPTGLIISPSHEAILPDIPPQNIEALFSAIQH